MALIVVLCNVSDLADVSNYTYQVMVGDGTASNSRTIVAGTVLNHTRSEGWQKLVQMMLDKETGK